MNNWKRIGYVSVELVITAALIMAVGFFLLFDFGTTGSQMVQNGMDKLDALGVFGGGGSSVDDTMEYDENGYPKELNINPADINPVSDFDFVYSDELAGWVVVKYNNTSDMTVVVPKLHSDGRPVVKVGGIGEAGNVEGAFENQSIESMVLPNSIVVIGEDSLFGTWFETIIIPDSVYAIENNAFQYTSLVSVKIPASVVSLAENAFYYSSLETMEFKGNVPSSLGADSLYGNDFEGPSIKVTEAALDAYRANAEIFGVDPSVFYALSAPVVFDSGCYAPSLGITESDVNSADDFDWWWDEDLGGWTIQDYLNSEDKDVVIPCHHSTGLPVLGIGDNAMSWSDLTSVAIPNSVVNIGIFAFSDNQLTDLIIPESVEFIGGGAFNSNLLGQESAYIYSPTEPTKIVSYAGASLNPVIPSGTTIIGERSFRYIGDGLVSVSVPDTVTTIEWVAFESNNLTEINLPNSITSIGESAFNLNEISSLVLPGSVTTIGSSAFARNEITSLTLSEGLQTIGYGAFSNNQLGSLDLPNSVRVISEEAFMNNLLTTLSIPQGVVSIGRQAFNNNQLPSAEAFIYASGTDTETLVSYGGLSLTPVIPEGVRIIEHSAFANSKITSVSFPSTLEVIGEASFNTTKLTSVVVPNSVTVIKSRAFYNTNTITTLTLSNTLKRIEDQAFTYAWMSSVVLPETLEYIGSQAFRYSRLSSIVIPASVTYLGSSAFRDNTWMTSVRFEGALPELSWTGYIFTNCYNLGTSSVRVPSAYLTAYRDVASKFGLTTTRFVGY